MTPFKVVMVAIFLFSMVFSPLLADDDGQLKKKIFHLEKRFENLGHRLDKLEKAIDDIMWFHRLGDVAYIDKVRHVGPPRSKVKNPTAMGVKNPVKFYSYVFMICLVKIKEFTC